MNINKKPHNIFQIYVYSKFLDDKDKGAWAALVICYPQDCSIKPNSQTTYLISSIEEETSIRLRLISLRESLKWVLRPDSSVEIELFLSDIFLYSIMKEWLPKWRRKNYKLSNNEDRPNADILKEIGDLSMEINITTEYCVEVDHSMNILQKKVDTLLAKE